MECAGDTHTKALVKIASDVYPHGFDRHCTAIVFGPKYGRMAAIILFDQLPVQAFV